MSLVTLAESGGNPTAMSTGKVSRDPAPAMVLTAPAATPVTATTASSRGVMGSASARAATGLADRGGRSIGPT